MRSLENFAAEKLSVLEAGSLRRELTTTARAENAIVWRNGRRLVSFSCNDYLNLSTHPDIIAAAIAATQQYGVGAGGSRAVTGNHPLYEQLESRLAAHKVTESALVFGSGYLANSGIIPALIGPEDAIFIDALAHACIWSGAKLSGAKIIPFAHNGTAELARLLHQHRAAHRHAIIATDSVFSMDGDLAPVADLADLADIFDVWLLTDDAHGLGVVPKIPGTERVPLQMGTLSKAIGGYGGYVCASAQVITLIRNRARSYVYTTGLPPGTIAAAIAALDLIAANPGFAVQPLAKARSFTQALDLPEAASPIVPIIIGEAKVTLAASKTLEEAGFLVSAIRPPTVPPGTARLRCTFTANHTAADIAGLAEAMRGILGA